MCHSMLPVLGVRYICRHEEQSPGQRPRDIAVRRCSCSINRLAFFGPCLPSLSFFLSFSKVNHCNPQAGSTSWLLREAFSLRYLPIPAFFRLQAAGHLFLCPTAVPHLPKPILSLLLPSSVLSLPPSPFLSFGPSLSPLAPLPSSYQQHLRPWVRPGGNTMQQSLWSGLRLRLLPHR